jgi:hypothetical protein
MDAARGRRGDSIGGGGIGLEPGMVLPAQIFGKPGLDASLVPEKRLLLAVLEEAVVTFQRYATEHGRRGRRLFREAEEWMGSEELCWPCSFRNICDALGLDPGYLRQGLRRWRDEQEANPGLYTPHRHPFRRLSGSRTRAIGRPIGLGRRTRAQLSI